MKGGAFSAEAVLPCLLDRLCDENPEQTAGREPQSSFTLGRYRQSVVRDLGWLLNSAAHPADDILADYPEAAASVINFGTPDLTGLTISSASNVDLENSLRVAIRRFEPRILPNSLEVNLLPPPKNAPPNQVNFEIRALLWGNPMPERFLLKTHIDLETGECAL